MTQLTEEAAPEIKVAVIIGASGGIGAALTAQLKGSRDFDRVLALSRAPTASDDTLPTQGAIDITDETSIAAAATNASRLGTLRLIIVATGLLHGHGIEPEKNLRALNARALAQAFAVNSIGPALVAKHFLPLLPRVGRSVFAALSARVGSISDNRRGGWYAYRASKAALNMLLKNCAIELARSAPAALCIGLHPGTVDTRLSAPFRRSVAPGRLFGPAQAAAHLLRVIGAAQATDSGHVLAWDGSRIAA